MTEEKAVEAATAPSPEELEKLQMIQHEEKTKEMQTIVSKVCQMYSLDVVATVTMRLVTSLYEALKKADAPPQVLMFCAGILTGTGENLLALAKGADQESKEADGE